MSGCTMAILIVPEGYSADISGLFAYILLVDL